MSRAGIPRVESLVAIDRTVADLARTEAFYRDGLGFTRIVPPEPIPPAMLQALGLKGSGGRYLQMRIGGQTMRFLAFDEPGRPYPPGSAATDPWFQHAAIVVRDMAAAYRCLAALDPTPITQGGPQTLPPSSGGVGAYKFRDPDDHPLELLAFPDGAAPQPWAAATGLFFGIDHSAVTVTDLEASLAFFCGGLGLSVETRGLNRGPEQAALDGVAGPIVDVLGLRPAGRPTPHVELLHYRAPGHRDATASRFTARDRATTRFVFATPDLQTLMAHLRGTHPDRPIRVSEDGLAAGLEGPDGHGILLLQANADRPRS